MADDRMKVSRATIELLKDGVLAGDPVNRTVRRIGDLANLFHDGSRVQSVDPHALIYEVDTYSPLEGALNFGITRLQPGRVGNECYMTKGHVHLIGDRTEFYWGIDGTGCLLIGDKTGSWRLEQVNRGSVHFIPPFCFHRLINTGGERLAIGAVWPSDAGHNYDSFERERIPRVVIEDGQIRVLFGGESSER